jgi:hypothetical protein
MEVLSKSRYRVWLESALGGSTSTFHVANLLPQAIASGAGTIIYVGNVNDPAYAVTTASSIANLDATVAACKAAGVCIVLLTDPSASNTSDQNAFHGPGGINEHILGLHDPTHGVISIEIRDIFLQQTLGGYLPWTAKTDVFYDSPQIHWSIRAGRQIGERIVNTFDALDWWNASPGQPAPSRNIIPNADFATSTGGSVGTNNTGTLPSGFTGQSSVSGVAIVWSVNQRADGTREIVGVVTRDSSAGTSLRRHEVAVTITPTSFGIALGDYIQAGGIVTVEDGHTNVVGTHVMSDVAYTGGPGFEQCYKMLASTSNGIYPYPSGEYRDLDLRATAHKLNPLATALGTCKIRLGIQTNGVCTATFRIRLPWCIKLNTDERQAEIDMFPFYAAFPTLSGTTTVGNVLTATTNTWVANPAPTLAYQWYRTPDIASNGVAISGATSTTYTIQAGDAGSILFCRVFATTSRGTNSADTPLSAAVT